MNLRLFRPNARPDFNYKRFDHFNSCTGRLSCRLLELTGWYTSSIPLRLLGHYRLYQLYKKRRTKNPLALPPIQGYILQYRASYWIKHYWYVLLSRIPTVLGHPDDNVEMQALNNVLIHQRADILYAFLSTADSDFETALSKAVQQITDPDFINIAPIAKAQPSNLFFNLEQHNSYTDAHNELNIHPIIEKNTTVEKETIFEKDTTIKEIIIKEPASKELNGKEKGVFSKKQVLILLDLLAYDGKFDHLRLDKPDKTEPIAKFLMALTGKGIDTWLETLQDYRSKDLYAYNTDPERKNLLSTLDTLSSITHNAGLRILAKLVDKKITEIERRR